MAQIQSTTKISVWLFLVTFSFTFYGMGAAFVESFVNYPTWPLIGKSEFRSFHEAISPLVIRYLVIPLIITTILTILLLWHRPAPIPAWAIWISVMLQLSIWISTALIQIPIQLQLSNDGLSVPLIESLIYTNWWFRKVPQIINAFLFFWMMNLLLFNNFRKEARSDQNFPISG